MYAPDIDLAIKVHLHYCLYRICLDYINEYKFEDPKIKPLLHLLMKVFAIEHISKDTSPLYEAGYF